MNKVTKESPWPEWGEGASITEEVDLDGVTIAPTRYEFAAEGGPTVVIERVVHHFPERRVYWLITQPDTTKIGARYGVRHNPEFENIADAFAAAVDLAKVLAKLARRQFKSDRIITDWGERHQ